MNIKKLKELVGKLREDLKLQSVLSKMLPLNELFLCDTEKKEDKKITDRSKQ